MLTFYVVGLIVTTVLFMWFVLDYYGGFKPILTAVKNNVGGTGSPSPLLVFSVMLGSSLLLSAVGWPLVMIMILINLNARYKTTGQLKILVPKVPK